MKQIWQVVGISVGILFWVALQPVFAGSAKIGVIDVEKIMRESVAARDARGLFLLDVEAKRAVLRSKEKEIRRMETVPEAQQGDLSTNGKNKKNEKRAQALKNLRHLRDDMEDDLNKKEKEMRRKLLKEIKDAAKAYLQEKKYTVIIEKKTLFVFDETVDVTDDVIKFYDAKKQ